MSIARDTKPCNQSVSARPKFHAGTGLMLYEQQTPRGIMFVTPHQRHIDDVDRGCLNSSSGIIVPGSPSNRL
jgi:hypothetical protein